MPAKPPPLCLPVAVLTPFLPPPAVHWGCVLPGGLGRGWGGQQGLCRIEIGSLPFMLELLLFSLQLCSAPCAFVLLAGDICSDAWISSTTLLTFMFHAKSSTAWLQPGGLCEAGTGLSVPTDDTSSLRAGIPGAFSTSGARGSGGSSSSASLARAAATGSLVSVGLPGVGKVPLIQLLDCHTSFPVVQPLLCDISPLDSHTYLALVQFLVSHGSAWRNFLDFLPLVKLSGCHFPQARLWAADVCPLRKLLVRVVFSLAHGDKGLLLLSPTVTGLSCHLPPPTAR